MRGFTVLRAVVVVAATAVLFAGCGDSRLQGMIQEQIDQASQLEREYDLDVTSHAVIVQLGGSGTAAYAVLKASDNGYSPYQVASAINAGLLDESGVIPGVTPARPAGTSLSSRDSVTRFLVAYVDAGLPPGVVIADNGDVSPGLSELGQMFGEINDQSQAGRWLAWVLGATGAGYSAGQITDYLDENPPSKQESPPTIAGVPVITAGGAIAVPELGTDWPYRGRNILKGFQDSGDFDFEENQWVLVIGLVNAGYTEDQIKVSVGWERIGLCTSQDGQSLTVGLLDKDGAIIPPAGGSPDSLGPARVVIEDVFTLWPGTGGATGGAAADNASKLQSGQAVSLKLTPYIASPDSNKAITSHEIVLEIKPSEYGTWYYFTCRWKVELVQVKTDYNFEKGTTFVCEGEAYSEEGKTRPLEDFPRLPTDYTYAAFDPAGELLYRVTDSAVGFGGRLDEDLEGDGWFPNGGFPTIVNWDTYPGVLPGG